MRKIVFIFMMLVIASTPFYTYGQPLKTIDSDDDFSQFLTYYYLNPQPDLIDKAINYASSAGMCGKPSVAPPLIGFFTEVFSANKEKLSQWQTVIDKQDASTKSVMTLAMKLSVDPLQIIEFKPLTPESNDMCCGAFFASGKAVYIKALVDKLSYMSERKDIAVYSTAASAKWSLSSNARMHPAVLKELQRLKAEAKPEISKQLEEAISQEPNLIKQETTEVLKAQHQKGIW